MPAPEPLLPRAEAVVDLDAISANVAALRQHVGGRDLMAVVKADGYGHGIVESGRAARAGGAGWLGVALLDEALTLRAAGDTGPILSWLAVPGERYAAAVEAGVHVTANSLDQLRAIIAAAQRVGTPAGVQLKVDSGLGRSGAPPHAWPALVSAAADAQRRGTIAVDGVWSHFACADEPEHPSVQAQLGSFATALGEVRSAGLDPEHVHFANSAAALGVPDSWHTMIRPGIALYGVSPFADGHSPVALRPAVRVVAALSLVKRVPAGHGVSYGHTYTTTRETTLALVPIGYGDGVPRHASNRGPVRIGETTHRIAGRVCMDQFVVDVGDQPVAAGDPAVLIGEPARGEPSVTDWADAADTIGYEIVSRLGSRLPRRYVGGTT